MKISNDNCRFVYLKGLPNSINGFVQEEDGYYTVVLNAKMSHQTQRKTIEHEVGHILRDDFEKYSVDEAEL